MPSPQSTQIVPANQKISQLRDLVKRQMPAIQAALPKHVESERFARLALTTFGNVPGLLDCTPQSLILGMMQAAGWGLELDPQLGLAYLIPYGKEAKLIIGYRGLIKLALQSDQVKRVWARAVREADLVKPGQFEVVYGLDDRIVHVPNLLAPDRGKLIAVYAVADMGDGVFHFDVMTVAEVDLIRARSRASKSGPWVTDYEAMALKTVIRRMAKLIPQSPNLAKALDDEERIERDEAGIIDIALEPPIDTAATDAPAATSKIDELTDTLAAASEKKAAPAADAAAAPADPTPATAEGAKAPAPPKPKGGPAAPQPPNAGKTAEEQARDSGRAEQASRHEVPRGLLEREPGQEG